MAAKNNKKSNRERALEKLASEIAKARQDVKEGRFYTHEEVVEMLKSRDS